jgi:hypothetical protein
MHSQEVATSAVGGAVGGALAMANGLSLLSIDWEHTAEYGVNMLLGTVIVTVVKLIADHAISYFRKSKRRRPKNAQPRRTP